MSIPTDSNSRKLDPNPRLEFQWKIEPMAGAWVKSAMAAALADLPWTVEFASRLEHSAGVRMIDLLDTVFLGQGSDRLQMALDAGWIESNAVELKGQHFKGYQHPGGLFPTIAVYDDIKANEIWLSMRVEFVADFLAANDLTRDIQIGRAHV